MKIPRCKIADSINNGVTKIVSAMKQKHMEDLLEKARVSVLFSPKQVKDFMYPWQIVTGTNCNRLTGE